MSSTLTPRVAAIRSALSKSASSILMLFTAAPLPQLLPDRIMICAGAPASQAGSWPADAAAT